MKARAFGPHVDVRYKKVSAALTGVLPKKFSQLKQKYVQRESDSALKREDRDRCTRASV